MDMQRIVAGILSGMSLKEKSLIAQMDEKSLPYLQYASMCISAKTQAMIRKPVVKPLNGSGRPCRRPTEFGSSGKVKKRERGEAGFLAAQGKLPIGKTFTICAGDDKARVACWQQVADAQNRP